MQLEFESFAIAQENLSSNNLRFSLYYCYLGIRMGKAHQKMLSTLVGLSMLLFKLARQYLNLNNLFSLYLDNIIRNGPRTASGRTFHLTILTANICYLFIPAYLLLFPTTDELTRLVLYDESLFYGISPNFNLALLVLALDTVLFHHLLHQPPTEALILVRKVLYQHNRNQVGFFVENVQFDSNGLPLKLSVDLVRQRTRYFILIPNYFLLSSGLCRLIVEIPNLALISFLF